MSDLSVTSGSNGVIPQGISPSLGSRAIQIFTKHLPITVIVLTILVVIVKLYNKYYDKKTSDDNDKIFKELDKTKLAAKEKQDAYNKKVSQERETAKAKREQEAKQKLESQQRIDASKAKQDELLQRQEAARPEREQVAQQRIEKKVEARHADSEDENANLELWQLPSEALYADITNSDTSSTNSDTKLKRLVVAHKELTARGLAEIQAFGDAFIKKLEEEAAASAQENKLRYAELQKQSAADSAELRKLVKEIVSRDK